MAIETRAKKTCETCSFWDGKPSTYFGGCRHPGSYASRVPFDYSCPLHVARQPSLSMQSQVRGNAAPRPGP